MRQSTYEAPVSCKGRFIRLQSIKACLGALVCLAYAGLVGRPDGVGDLVLVGLMAPAALALAAILPLPLWRLEAASLLLVAGLFGLLGAFTGGLASPFLVWLLLVPFESVLIGRRGAAMLAGIASLAVIFGVGALQLAGSLPESRLSAGQPFLLDAVLLAAIVQASLIAVAVQARSLAADAAAEEGQARYRFLADNVFDLITLHGADGRIRFASPASTPLLNYAPDELVGRSFVEFSHEDDRAATEKAFADARGGRRATVELRLKTKNGTEVWSEIRCRPAAGGDSVAVTRDITRRKNHERALVAARDQAEEASRAKSRFLANMSHELRTPLNAIIGFSDVMNHEMFGPLGNARYTDYSRLINASGTHLLELINSILDMSKIEAGRFTITPERFDLEDTIVQVFGFVGLQAETQGVTLEHRVAPEVRHVVADKRAVLQILTNLLSNAVKYTLKGGHVVVTADGGPGRLELAVSDTGVGIGEEDLARLGQPFVQVESEYTRTKEGTGLGLALVRALTHLHGGTMTLTSRLGEGTRVHIALPNAAEPAKAAPVHAVA